MCSGSEAGSYSRLIDFGYHSTLGSRVIKKRGGWGDLLGKGGGPGEGVWPTHRYLAQQPHLSCFSLTITLTINGTSDLLGVSAGILNISHGARTCIVPARFSVLYKSIDSAGFSVLYSRWRGVV